MGTVALFINNIVCEHFLYTVLQNVFILSVSLFTDEQRKLLDDFDVKWKALKSVIDDYPQGFSLEYDNEKGYIMRLHLDYLVPREEV